MLYLLRVTLVAVFSVFCSFVAADFTEEDGYFNKEEDKSEKCNYDYKTCIKTNIKTISECGEEHLKCLISAYEESDSKLNEIYQRLVVHLQEKPSYMLNNLKKAQRNWIKFRDDWCKYEESRFMTGHMSTTFYFDCLNEFTKEQIKNLERSLDDKTFP